MITGCGVPGRHASICGTFPYGTTMKRFPDLSHVMPLGQWSESDASAIVALCDASMRKIRSEPATCAIESPLAFTPMSVT